MIPGVIKLLVLRLKYADLFMYCLLSTVSFWTCIIYALISLFLPLKPVNCLKCSFWIILNKYIFRKPHQDWKKNEWEWKISFRSEIPAKVGKMPIFEAWVLEAKAPLMESVLRGKKIPWGRKDLWFIFPVFPQSHLVSSQTGHLSGFQRGEIIQQTITKVQLRGWTLVGHLRPF